jgi:hypothetical protein
LEVPEEGEVHPCGYSEVSPGGVRQGARNFSLKNTAILNRN